MIFVIIEVICNGSQCNGKVFPDTFDQGSLLLGLRRKRRDPLDMLQDSLDVGVDLLHLIYRF